MCANSLDELFEDGLQHAYYAEQQLADALEELESTSSDEQIQSAFAEHREETQGHVDQLEEVFDAIGSSPEAKEDRAVSGLIEDHEEFVSQDPDQEALDRYNVAAGVKSEHYEMATYGTLIPLAEQLDHEGVASSLEGLYREEEHALEELSRISEVFHAYQ